MSIEKHIFGGTKKQRQQLSKSFMTQKKIKPKAVKAYAIVDNGGEIFNVQGLLKGHGEPLAIYESDGYFNKDILKSYDAKIIPVKIFPINN